jgi:hypothetical protein
MRRIEWQRETRVPRCVAAVLDGLRFDAADVNWPTANDQEWERAIYYLHRNQLTLIANLPPNLQARADRFRRANSARLSCLRARTEEVIAELRRAGIETVLLKGFARAGEYVHDPELRMHYDIDLYYPEAAERAMDVLRAIGYEPIAGAESDAAGHLVPLARPTSWKWRDDFFDLETPVHVELHELLWVPQIECFSFPGLEQFWDRRENDHYCTLSRHDTLAYRCLHLLRHLLRGDIRAAGVYEIAYFLHQNRSDDGFWRGWQSLYLKDLQQAQAVCFALAQRWFGCEMHSIPLMAVRDLPQRVLEWMEQSAASPVESFFKPAKHELALHFALVGSAGARFRIALRRLMPLRHSARMWEDRAAYLARLRTRAIYHAKALAPTLSRLLTIRR